MNGVLEKFPFAQKLKYLFKEQLLNWFSFLVFEFSNQNTLFPVIYMEVEEKGINCHSTKTFREKLPKITKLPTTSQKLSLSSPPFFSLPFIYTLHFMTKPSSDQNITEMGSIPHIVEDFKGVLRVGSTLDPPPFPSTFMSTTMP